AAEVIPAAGVDLPETYEEELPGRSPSSGRGTFSLTSRERYDFRDAVMLLTNPAPCPQWSGDVPPITALDAEEFIVEWAVARHGERPNVYSRPMEKWLPRLDDAVTTAWVIDTFRRFTTCDFDRLAMPWE
uniref:hypothetical protein n=1 Tax=Nocardioides stalactiti TaxID=2755356 RepID=UPI0016000906